VNVLGKTKEGHAGDASEPIFDEQARVEAEKAAETREAFDLLLRLFTYMLKEWIYYGTAFTFLFLYSIGMCGCFYNIRNCCTGITNR
jgi:hypothetical protein